MRILNKKAFSVIEYAVLFVIVIGAIVVMRDYLQRGIYGNWGKSGQSFAYGRQFDSQSTIECDYDLQSNQWYDHNCYKSYGNVGTCVTPNCNKVNASLPIINPIVGGCSTWSPCYAFGQTPTTAASLQNYTQANCGIAGVQYCLTPWTSPPQSQSCSGNLPDNGGCNGYGPCSATQCGVQGTKTCLPADTIYASCGGTPGIYTEQCYGTGANCGSSTCSTDLCGNSCGGNDGSCDDGQTCNSGSCGSRCSACQTWNGSACVTSRPCGVSTCGTDSCGNICGTGTCSSGTCSYANDPGTCTGTCTPKIYCSTTLNCGTDSCQNSCGSCSPDETCNSSSGPGSCVPRCSGCQSWNGFACVSSTACGTSNCGHDSCGNPCGTTSGACASGTCSSPDLSEPGTCTGTCTPATTCGTNTCGKDICGNSCGTCPSGYTCSTISGPGSCVTSCSSCQTWDGNGCVSTIPCGIYTCGKDSCGNACGADNGNCTGVTVCSSSNEPGVCVAGCPPCETSDGSTCVTTIPCGDSDCGTDSCGESCGTNNGDCLSGSCGNSSLNRPGMCNCSPQMPCGDNDCGFDDCGNSCGTCNVSLGQTCSSFTGPGQCVSTCLACQTWNGSACVSTIPCGSSNCGHDSCGNACPSGGTGTCSGGTVCSSSNPSTTPGTCGCIVTASCPATNGCNTDNCGTSCGTCPEGISCSTSVLNTPGTCGCSPAIPCSSTLNCGTDSCGNECNGTGTCPGTEVCSSNTSGYPGSCEQNCLACQTWNGTECVTTTACGTGSNACGTDSCGKSCGTCAGGVMCGNSSPSMPGTCGCQPQTACSATLNCSTDDCGDSCGTCPQGQRCSSNAPDTPGSCISICLSCQTWVGSECVSTVPCSSSTCGYDSCGNICGTGSTCPSGNCSSSSQTAPGMCNCVPQVDCSSTIDCSTDSCGDSCGICSSGLTCNSNTADLPGLCEQQCLPCQTWNGTACVTTTPCGSSNCGFDSCGNTCGACSPGTTCGSSAPGTPGICGCSVSATAACPSLDGCSTDNCGNSCGTCAQGTTCSSSTHGTPGTCSCVPAISCSGFFNCSTNSCGTACGNNGGGCSTGFSCSSSTPRTPGTCQVDHCNSQSLPANSSTCMYDIEPTTNLKQYSLVNPCPASSAASEALPNNGGSCLAQCNVGYYSNGTACVPNICLQSSLPSNAAACAIPPNALPVSNNTQNYSLVGSCDSGTCESTCKYGPICGSGATSQCCPNNETCTAGACVCTNPGTCVLPNGVCGTGINSCGLSCTVACTAPQYCSAASQCAASPCTNKWINYSTCNTSDPLSHPSYGSANFTFSSVVATPANITAVENTCAQFCATQSLSTSCSEIYMGALAGGFMGNYTCYCYNGTQGTPTGTTASYSYLSSSCCISNGTCTAPCGSTSGIDNCGMSCTATSGTTCPYSGQTCVAGQCTCPTAGICNGATCGTDTCGNANACGTCPYSGQTCVSGACSCTTPGTCTPTAGQCGAGKDQCGNACTAGCTAPDYCSGTQCIAAPCTGWTNSESCSGTDQVGSEDYGTVAGTAVPAGAENICAQYCANCPNCLTATTCAQTVLSTAIGEVAPGSKNLRCYCYGAGSSPTSNNSNFYATNSCVATCQGTLSNATACVNNLPPTNSTTNYTLYNSNSCPVTAGTCNAQCTNGNVCGTGASAACCSTAQTCSAGVCQTNTCGTLPNYSTACINNPPAANNASYTAVSTCPSATTPGVCDATCITNATISGGACVCSNPCGSGVSATCCSNTQNCAASACQSNVCGTLPSGWTACTNNPPASNNAAYSLVSTCPSATTPGVCDATCTSGTLCGSGASAACCSASQTCSVGVCQTNTCGALPNYSTACINNPPATNNASYTAVSTCPSATTPGVCDVTCTYGSPCGVSAQCCSNMQNCNGTCQNNVCGSVPNNAAGCTNNPPATNNAAYSLVSSCPSTTTPGVCDATCIGGYSNSNGHCCLTCQTWSSSANACVITTACGSNNCGYDSCGNPCGGTGNCTVGTCSSSTANTPGECLGCSAANLTASSSEGCGGSAVGTGEVYYTGGKGSPQVQCAQHCGSYSTATCAEIGPCSDEASNCTGTAGYNGSTTNGYVCFCSNGSVVSGAVWGQAVACTAGGACQTSCAAGTVCTGPNNCCSPTTCSAQGVACGYASDYCADEIYCGTCSGTGSECASGTCCTPKTKCSTTNCVSDSCGVACTGICTGAKECDTSTQKCCTPTTACGTTYNCGYDSCGVPCGTDNGGCSYFGDSCVLVSGKKWGTCKLL